MALFIGALVGMDRERKEGKQFGGLRTFMLIGLSGAATAWVSRSLDTPWLVIGGLLGLVGLLATSYRVVSDEKEGKVGITGEVAAIVVFLLGAMCVLGDVAIAAVLGVATSALLTFKAPLHHLVAAMGKEDVSAILKLAFATFVVLPVLPAEAVDPWGVLVPQRLWWLVVLISALSLVGYVAVRMLGDNRGLALTGFFGGLVSSTAVTLAAARQAKVGSAHPGPLAMSVLLAWTVMFVRVPVEVAVVQPSLLPALLPAIGAMGLTVALFAAVLARGERGVTEGIELTNPFSLGRAMQFGALFAAVLFAVEAGNRLLDDSWLYAIAGLAGATDVDAIVLSTAEATQRDLDPDVAVGAMIIACLSNTVLKAIAGTWLGGWELGKRLLGGAALITVVGVAVSWGPALLSA